LTQNKTADSARKTFYRLQHRYKGIDVHKMAAADKHELEELIDVRAAQGRFYHPLLAGDH
jgi:hypothetical protein